jgi:hypothetical protein
MSDAERELDEKQAAYKQAVDAWVKAIRDEEALASVAHNVAEIDAWEAAAFHEEDLRNEARAAKTAYEDALRRVNFNF